MKNSGFNPYLPSWEYIPDGEPHIYDGRVYVYGSHDRFNGYAFCINDYVCWSASVEDLTDWKYEGVIYRRTDDPKNKDGEQTLYAPDVTKGPDGRYYLYYALNQTSEIAVAVSDKPAGRYEYYGVVHYDDGTPLGARPGDGIQFDPGVLTEKDKTYLYTGFCIPSPDSTSSSMVVLAEDMLTILEGPIPVIPGVGQSKGTGFEGHEFFEASSIRKVKDRYYFIYSSVLSHELCYATADTPVGPYTYRGTIVSNGDIGLTKNGKPADANLAFIGNNHGSIVEINGQWYVFYHRQTNGHNFSRQGCLEPIHILPDGSIPQVEITSCGPAGGVIAGKGEIPAYTACHLFMTTEPEINTRMGHSPYPRITQQGADAEDPTILRENAYIANITSGVVAGFRYFDCRNVSKLAVMVRGMIYGAIFSVYTDLTEEPVGEIQLHGSNEWHWEEAEISIPDGVQALYFKLTGYGNAEFMAFRLE